MPEIKSLENETVDRLYEAFMAAFADYTVPIAWSRSEFRENNLRRGLDLALSLGAYEGERIVGFIMNGKGKWEGMNAAYDLATGVLPEARGSGIAAELAARLVDLLPERGFKRYILEVIKDNAPAIKTYEKAGFAVTRSLECPAGSFADPGRKAPAGLEIVDLPGGKAFPRAAASSFREWDPTWQNSDDSIVRMPVSLILLGVRLGGPGGGRLVGHLVAEKNGTIWQLAVAKDFRRQGIGTALLRELAFRVGPKLRYINVEADDKSTLGLLAGCGFAKGVGQYEMAREFGKR